MGINDPNSSRFTKYLCFQKSWSVPIFIIVAGLFTVLITYGPYVTDISQHAQQYIYYVSQHIVKVGKYRKPATKYHHVNSTSVQKMKALWDSHYINGVPVKPTKDLPSCNEFIKTLVDPVSRFLLLAMYDPGNCAEISNPSHQFFQNLSLQDEAKEHFAQRYPQELPSMCRKTKGKIGDPNWRLCYKMPEKFHYANWVDQRYLYSRERQHAQNQLGQVCFRKTLALYFLPQNVNQKGGPRKVLNNLLSGLRRIGKPYIINARMLNRFDYLFSPDPHHGFLMYFMNDEEAKAFFIGPTVVSTQFTASRFRPSVRRFAHVVAASKRALASNQYFPGLPLDRKNAVIIPTGIDEDTFMPNSNISKDGRNHCLIYVKSGCNNAALSQVEKCLSSLRIKSKKIIYARYTEQVFRETLERSIFAIACDGAETQGMAFQEMMSMDVPLFVINQATVPYFSDEVGKILQQKEDISVSLKDFIKKVKLGKYKPRQWLIRNLSLAGSAINTMKAFCGIKNVWNP